jgi:hypothetical protein
VTEPVSPPGLGRRVLAVLRRDRILYLVTAAFAVGVSILAASMDASGYLRFFLYPQTATLVTIAMALLFFVWYAVRLGLQRHPRPLLVLWEKVLGVLKRPEEILAFVGVVGSTVVLISVFTSLKSMIPLIQPYVYDPPFAVWDRVLHLGVDPWKLSHGVFRGPYATAFIQFGYNLWFFAFWGVLLFYSLRLQDPRGRLQYLISHVLSWMLIGGVAAILMSSAGPVYYGRLVDGADPFVPLMDLLRSQDQWMVDAGWPIRVWALGVQEDLWSTYEAATTGLGSGISAMPSMHVAVAVLMALAMHRVNRWVGVAFWAFALIIQIGSVHLAWHYAIDGYVAAVMVVAIWKGTGWVVDRHLESVAPEERETGATPS